MLTGSGQINALLPVSNHLQDTTLRSSFQMVDYFIRRNYLAELPSCPVLEFSAPEDTKNIRLFRIDKLIYDEAEEVNEKLTSVYSALQSLNVTVYTLVIGKATGTEFYLGARSDGSASIPSDVLSQSFKAHFPGSSMVSKWDDEINRILDGQNYENICSVTVVPSQREDNEKEFIQGIEKLMDAMQGKEYSAIFISTPISKEALDKHRLGLEQLYSAISPYAKTTFAYGENQSDAVSQGTFTNFTSTINEGISNSLGESLSTSTNNSSGFSALGFSSSQGSSISKSTSSSSTVSRGTATSEGSGTNANQTRTTGTNQTLTKESVDKTAENMLEYIDRQFERIQNYESFGAWETAAYFCSDRIDNSIVAANTFRALVSGEKTNSEYSYINVWDRLNPYTKDVSRYLRYCRHPRFIIGGSDFLDARTVTAGNYISGKELPVFMSLPQKSVSGITVTTMADFSRNVSHRAELGAAPERTVPLGCVHHMGLDEPSNAVSLDLDSFTSHCFICGSTGSGKSNTTYHLLQRFIRHNIPFLVIEPAKGEYKAAFGNVPGIHTFHTNPYMGAMLKINPFQFHPNIHVLEHLDRLIEIFNACWEMYAAMPAILKSAIEKAYLQKGWDLQNSLFIKGTVPQYPTFADVLAALPQIIRSSSYSADTQGDYIGALVTRVESLTNGLAGQIFCDNYYLPDAELFDENTIVDLSRIGSAETKSLIMGILVMRLNEYRIAMANGSNKELRHITVLEEAHHLLKNVSQAQGQQSANPIGKSVEMICNSIAEMRTYGEGFIIVDQSPSSVDIAAIKNTNTKIAMRLPEKHDCEVIGSSLSLNEYQVKELSKLPVGVAVVLQNNWLEAVLCKIRPANDRYHKEPEKNTMDQLKQFRGAVIEELLMEYNKTTAIHLSNLRAIVDGADVSPSTKREMTGRLEALADALHREDKAYYYTSLLHISGLRGLFAAFESEHGGHEADKTRLAVWQASAETQMRHMLTFSSDLFYPALLKRCVFAMRWQSSNVNYPLVYKTLYD